MIIMELGFRQAGMHQSSYGIFGKFTKIIVHPTSHLPQIQVNGGLSMFKSFYTFLNNDGVVPRTQDAVFLCGADLDDEDLTELLHPTSAFFKESYAQSKPVYEIGQQLKFTRDGHFEKVTLYSVDVDLDTMVPAYNIKIKNGLTTSVTKEYTSTIDTERLSYIPITCE